MPVTLTLARRGAYTNLDWIEGEVKLDINSSESIENITVKVEGEENLISINNDRDQQNNCLCKETWQ
jgi:hypothetical protein